MTRCRRCNKQLTRKESIERKHGAICIFYVIRQRVLKIQEQKADAIRRKQAKRLFKKAADSMRYMWGLPWYYRENIVLGTTETLQYWLSKMSRLERPTKEQLMEIIHIADYVKTITG